VLTVRVHRELLASEGLQDAVRGAKAIWHDRYRSIRNLEKHLFSNGTRIVKFFLHLSKEEQRKRFLTRIDEPEKNWKFSLNDVEERRHWNSYMKAYERCIGATSTELSPWYIVPADDKQNARLIVSQIVLATDWRVDRRLMINNFYYPVGSLFLDFAQTGCGGPQICCSKDSL
jgi:polyphosphate kinase 2 (PPK2 family)